MGLSLPKIGKNIWEMLTPQNEEAQRQANANLQRANQAMAQPAKYGVFRDQQVQQNAITQNQAPQLNVPGVIKNRSTGLGLGALRSLTGTAQGLSGIYDIATPGLGTNRFSKGLDSFAKSIDSTAANERVGNIYKGGQLATDALQMVAPSALARVASGVPGAAKISAPFVRANSYIDDITRLPKSATAGERIAARALEGLRPSNVFNVVSGTANDLGQIASRGQDVNWKNAGLSVGANVGLGVGVPVAGQALAEGAKKLPKVAAKGAQTTVKVAKKFDESLVDPELIRTRNRYQKAFDVETNPTRRKQINQGLTDINKQIRESGASGHTQIGSPLIPVTNERPVVTVKPRDTLSIGQKLSPDRIIREGVTQPLREGVNKAIFKAQTSENPLARGVGRFAQGVSRELGVTEELKAAKRKLHGGIESGKLLREDIADAGNAFSPTSKQKVWATLDPERAGKLGVSTDTKLTKQEIAYRDSLKQHIDTTTQGNLERGLITPEQAANGSYIKRGYSVFEEGGDVSKAYQQTRDSLLKQFKGREDVTGDLIDKAITDPSYLVAKKAAESHAAWAMVDYGNHLSSTGLTSVKPRAGYTQLPKSKLFGEAAGMYVPKGVAEDFTGFQYSNGVISAFNDLITAYDNLGIRKAKKELLTIFNPAVRAGNQFSNRVVFSNLNGINPIQFQKNMMAAKTAIKTRNGLYREAVEQGLTGLDITQSDFARRIAEGAGDPNLASKALDYVKKSYSNADDQARIAAYITHRSRGYAPEEAARLTQRGFQDYKSVGFFYDMAAKTPFIGNAFARFAGDATRIATNAALDHPLRTASTVALWATFVNGMSKISGESPEDKKTREDRFGAPKLPFSNISTAVQTPWGEVNVSRFLPFYQLNETQGALGKLLPISKSPLAVKDGKIGIDPAAFNDPLLGQAVQLAADKDFRGKSIRDPENTGQFVDPLSSEQQKRNVAKWLAVGNAPVGREIDSVLSAATGKKDIYGKERSLPQALLRAGGVKVEQFGKEQAKEQRAVNTYFDEKQAIESDIKGMSAKDQEAYKRLSGYYKLRQKTANEFKPGDDRYVKAPVYEFPEDKWKEYTTSPKMYDLMLQKKQKDNTRQGTPIQPEFDNRLSTGFRKQLINNKSLAPGEDVEADERMYSNPEWDLYQKIKGEYDQKAKQYYPKGNGDYADELVKHKQAAFPEKPAAKAAYDAAFAAYAGGKGAKPEFTDAVKQARDQYSEAKRQWTNTERKARGLPDITRDVWENKTFGYDSSESGFSYGYGNKKKPRIYASNFVERDVVRKGRAAPKVSVSLKKSKARPVYASGTKPKVTIKKSRV